MAYIDGRRDKNVKMWNAEGKWPCCTYAKRSSFTAENQQIMSDVYQEIF